MQIIDKCIIDNHSNFYQSLIKSILPHYNMESRANLPYFNFSIHKYYSILHFSSQFIYIKN